MSEVKSYIRNRDGRPIDERFQAFINDELLREHLIENLREILGPISRSECQPIIERGKWLFEHPDYVD